MTIKEVNCDARFEIMTILKRPHSGRKTDFPSMAIEDIFQLFLRMVKKAGIGSRPSMEQVM